MEFSRPEYWSGLSFAAPGDLPDPGIKPRSPALQADSLPSESPGKSKTTGLGSYSLLQGIFPTQGLNPGVLPCRQILYCLSHNVHGLNSLIERYRVAGWIKRQNPTIHCLQETYLSFKERYQLRVKGWKVILQANGSQKKAGNCRRMCMLSCYAESKSLRPHGLQPTRLFCSWDFPD